MQLSVVLEGVLVLGCAALAAGCGPRSSSTVDETSDETSDEVRVATCPKRLALHLGKPAILASTPAMAADGSELTSVEKRTVTERMIEARRFGPPSFRFELASTTRGGRAGVLEDAAAPAGTIGSAVASLRGAISGPGRDDVQSIAGATATDLVKSYIAARWADDPETIARYTYDANASSLLSDVPRAGVLSASVARHDAVEQVGAWYADGQEAAATKRARLDAVGTAIDAAAAAGAIFGFDGLEQNGCATPTAFLLVLDRANGKGYGIDLNPCTE